MGDADADAHDDDYDETYVALALVDMHVMLPLLIFFFGVAYFWALVCCM